MKIKLITALGLMLCLAFTSQNAFAGPTYVNVKVPAKCGDWKIVRHNHCPASPGKKQAGKAGTLAYMKCVGGGNGKSDFVIQSTNCSECIIGTHNKAFKATDIGAPSSAVGKLGAVGKAAEIGKMVYEDRQHKMYSANTNCYIYQKVSGNTAYFTFNEKLAANPKNRSDFADEGRLCQKMSDDYAIVANKGFGWASGTVRKEWVRLKCTTSPDGRKTASLCQKLSNKFKISANKTFGNADAQAKGSWIAMSCNTHPM